MNYQDIFEQNVKKIKLEGRYRNFRALYKSANIYPRVIDSNGREVTVWCSNDYLGMSMNSEVISSCVAEANSSGIGSGGTRNISGTSMQISALEEKIASFHGKESGLVFTSGYVSNLATISALVQIIPEIVIFSDEKNHASIISGIRHSRAKKEIFKHNDCIHLDALLGKYDKSTPKLIVIEGVYSMDASTPDLPGIVELAKKYNAMTYIDEVHAVGLYGKNGAGITSYYGLKSEIDIIQGTFAKSFGSVGGYITSSRTIVDAVRLNASSFIFTTSLPAMICAGISKSIDIIASDQGSLLRKKHFENVATLKSSLVQEKIDFIQNENINTHIIPIIIGNAQKAEEISNALFDKHNIYVQHINYPTVPVGTERLRVTVSPLHTNEMIFELVGALKVLL